MTTEQLQRQFFQQQAVRATYHHAMTVLSYDAETAMPRQGGLGYSRTMGALAEKKYALLVDEQLQHTIAELLQRQEEIPRWMFRECEELARRIRKTKVVPVEEYSQFQQDAALAGQVWAEAKRQADFSLFQPYLEKVLQHSLRFARYYDSSRPVYDVLLEDYEYGLTTAQLDAFFAQLKAQVLPLVQRISSQSQPQDDFLQGRFALPQQQELAQFLMEKISLDCSRCTLGQSEHPFSTCISNQDVRITTHYYEDNLLSSMYSVLHEGGHALYMTNTADELANTSLAEGASFSIHEAMSRLFENYIGRSQAFTTLALDKIKALFPAQFAKVDARQFYAAVNRSQPSLIRIEADELTYPLHILIRYELEKALVTGDLPVADLPGEWNLLYQQYLGLKAADDSQGVLQDMHWSGGNFGYFPTYALGSAYGAQIFSAMEQDLPVQQLIATDNISEIVKWLTDKLFCFGGVKTSAELLRDITGHGFDPSYYTQYLDNKFSSLYS